MKILLFGGSGQLGQEVIRRGYDLSFEIISPVNLEVNVTEEAQVMYLVKNVKPDVIINSAAYTAVDKAEEEKDLAFSINCDGAAIVAKAAKAAKARLIHISTDYVFSGNGATPLTEEDPTDPKSVYGASKLAGEEEIRRILGGEELIVRTSSLHGRYGPNFVHTMLSLFDQGKEVRVVDDQFMSPTWAGFLGEVLIDLCRMKEVAGLLHCSCSGIVSWYEFAQEILEHSSLIPSLISEQNTRASVTPIPMTELQRPAPRPKYSPFNLAKLTKVLGRSPTDWHVGLHEHLKEIGRIKNTH